MIVLDYPSDNYSKANGIAKVNDPQAIILHAMGQFIDEQSRDYFAPNYLEKLGVSAHMMVTPDGMAVRCVPDRYRAWHDKGNNTNTLGIEFLVPGLHTYETFLETIKNPWLPDPAFTAGQTIVRNWMKEYNIPKEKVFYHSETAPGRKLDPGAGFPKTFRDTL